MEKEILQLEDQTVDYQTTQANEANKLSEIFRLIVPPTLKYSILSGSWLKMKLCSTTGQISQVSYLYLMTYLPSQPDSPIQIGYEFSYAPWHNLTLEEQFISDRNQSLVFVIPHDSVTVNEDEGFIIAVKSPDVVSWASGKGTEINFRVQQETLKKS